MDRIRITGVKKIKGLGSVPWNIPTKTSYPVYNFSNMYYECIIISSITTLMMHKLVLSNIKVKYISYINSKIYQLKDNYDLIITILVDYLV